jgi:hypothetical protein
MVANEAREEPTPAMIEAGARYLRETYEISFGAERMAESVFLEMAAASKRSHRSRIR